MKLVALTPNGLRTRTQLLASVLEQLVVESNPPDARIILVEALDRVLAKLASTPAATRR